jgi:hypothetical protein
VAGHPAQDAAGAGHGADWTSAPAATADAVVWVSWTTPSPALTVTGWPVPASCPATPATAWLAPAAGITVSAAEITQTCPPVMAAPAV